MYQDNEHPHNQNDQQPNEHLPRDPHAEQHKEMNEPAKAKPTQAQAETKMDQSGTTDGLFQRANTDNAWGSPDSNASVNPAGSENHYSHVEHAVDPPASAGADTGAATSSTPVYEQNSQPHQQPYQPQQPQQAQQPYPPQGGYQQPYQTPYQQGPGPAQNGPPNQSPYQQQAPYQQKPTEPGALGGLDRNVASMLSYLFGWVTGLIFFFGDKRPEVRFHAAQSILVTGAITVLNFLLGLVRFASWRLWSILGTINTLLSLATLAFIIYMMVSAYQNKRVKLPIVGDTAEKMAYKQ